MDPSLAPIDVAQHIPFIVRKLIRTSPAVERAMWLVAVGQVDTEGEPCPVRARALAGSINHPDAPEPWVPSGGTAGRISVVLNELEERGVLVGYRGRGRRPHLWSFRPRLERWRGFQWEGSVESVSVVVGGCFCYAASDLVARFPGQSLVQVRKRAKFDLLPRDHITPPGLFLVENGDKIRGRAPEFQRPGAQPVDTRDNAWGQVAGGAGLSSFSEEQEVLPLEEERSKRFARLRSVVEYHARPKTVWPGSTPESTLVRLAAELSDEQATALVRHFDRTVDQVGIPTAVSTIEALANEMLLPRVAAAL